MKKIIIFCIGIFLLAFSVAAADVKLVCNPSSVLVGGQVTCVLQLPESVGKVSNIEYTVTGGTLVSMDCPSEFTGDFTTTNNKASCITAKEIIPTGLGSITVKMQSSGKVGLINLNILDYDFKPISLNVVSSNQITVGALTPACIAGDWDKSLTPCSATCGGGTQTLSYTKNAESDCVGDNPGTKVLTCNTQPCDLCKDVTCNPSSTTCPDGTKVSCTPTCNAATGSCGSCDLDCTDHMGTGGTTLIEPVALTILKARISSVLNENYEPETGITAADLAGYDYTSGNVGRVSKIANALKQYFLDE